MERVNGMLGLRGGRETVSVITAHPAKGQGTAVIDAAQGRWSGLDGLAGAALHSGFGGEVIELLRWKGAASADAAIAYGADPSLMLFHAGEGIATPGPDRAADGFVLDIDGGRPRPVLLSRIACQHGDQSRLMDYLLASAERFRGLFGGWVGAILYPSDDGRSVVEYLQFESPEAMMALQGLPMLDEHNANLAAFGAFEAVAAMPVAAWSHDPVQA
jgi:hypothetical protein